jgi:hypothetical protein
MAVLRIAAQFAFVAGVTGFPQFFQPPPDFVPLRARSPEFFLLFTKKDGPLFLLFFAMIFAPFRLR